MNGFGARRISAIVLWRYSQDLLEALTVPGRCVPRGGTQVAELFGVTAGADVLEVGAAAENALDA